MIDMKLRLKIIVDIFERLLRLKFVVTKFFYREYSFSLQKTINCRMLKVIMLKINRKYILLSSFQRSFF